MQLLTFPSLVEAPFIIVKIGDYTFGNYDKKSVNSKLFDVKYPNFMKSMSIRKVNGAVNTYTIVMEYGITQGDDPNFLERVFSSISANRTIEISYGDYAYPTFIYAKESALISKITSNTDFGNSRITYTISCVSKAFGARAGTYTFPRTYSKPSSVISDIISQHSYGISDIFPGMRDASKVLSSGLIPTDDVAVTMESKTCSLLDYLNYAVSCMQSSTDNPDDVIKKTRYYLTIRDDVTEDFDGTYFRITEVATASSGNSNYEKAENVYEVDIGYPTNDLVSGFTINTNDVYSILYNTSKNIKQSDYVYRISDDGTVEDVYSPTISNNVDMLHTGASDKTWWTNMTQFPITATMTVKGLLRPLMLMSYVKINVYFYGAKHISSGLYIITQQEDFIDQSGYKSVLNLTRVGGDKQ